MKRIVFIVWAALSCTLLWAQDANQVTFAFSSGIDNAAVKAKMEKQIMNLLTAINTAEANGTNINYSGIDIDNLASQTIGMSWNNVHFRTEDTDIVDRCISLKKKNGTLRGYQVRNIGVSMKPLNDTYKSEMRREICIDFSPSGRIIDFNFAMDTQTYTQLLKEGVRLDDVDRRLQIIHWCEQFRKAYNDKNLAFMENIFSDDALIITGKLTVKREPGDVGMVNQTKVEYVQRTKQEYLANLKKVFDANYKGYINVEFSDYNIVRHGSKPNYYGVTLIQKWNSTTYSDEGILFLVWSFADEDHPKIHVRTWQPMTEKAFALGDFKLP